MIDGKFILNHILFFVAYALLGAALSVGIELLTGLEVPTGFSITLGVIGSIGMASSFVRDHNRLPTKSEKRRLIIGAFIVMSALSFLIAGLLLVYDAEFQQVIRELKPHWQFTLTVLIAAELLYFAVIWFSFGLFASMFLKQQKEKADASNEP